MKKELFKLVCLLDRASSKILNRIKNRLNPLKDVEIPRVEGEFCSYSGPDVKVQILDPEEPIRDENDNRNGVVGWVQGISFGPYSTLSWGGTLVGIIFNSMRPFHKLLGQEKRLVLSGANEVGKVAILYDGIIKFDENMSWGISVDDIVVEVHIDFMQISQKLDLGKKVLSEDFYNRSNGASS